jgi:uncharacterized protein YggE
MKIIVRFCLPLLLLAAISYAQTAPAVTAQSNTVYSGADGKYEAAPDTAVLRLDIAAQQDTAREAYDKASVAAEQVRKVLRASGLDPKRAQVGFYAVQPMYDWKNPKRKIVGYRVATTVTLKLHDFSKVGVLTEQLANVEGAQNQTLSYTLEDMDQAKTKATEDAFRKAHSQAAAVAAAGGRTMGQLLFASVDVQQPTIVPVMAQPLMARAAMAEAVPPTAQFTPQEVTVTAHVNALFALK